MKSIPPIKAVMTPFPYWIDGERTLAEASRLMEERGIRHLAVKHDDALVGLVSDRDLERARLLHPTASSIPISEICVRKTYVVGLSEPLDRVLREMARRQIGSALVVKDGKLAGIFTTTDACRSFADLLESLFPGGGDEAA